MKVCRKLNYITPQDQITPSYLAMKEDRPEVVMELALLGSNQG